MHTIDLSIIIPTLNDGAVLMPLLQTLQTLRQAGQEIILSDGGSMDNTCLLAQPLVDQIVQGPAGRAQQMNRGARQAQGCWLWFVHADTRLTIDATQEFFGHLQHTRSDWGYCRLNFDSPRLVFRVIAQLMQQRTRFSQIATGDQGIFVRRRLFEQIGGYSAIPLMEDIALSRQLKHHSRPEYAPIRLMTSARRWQRQGIVRTILLMWWLRFAYFIGVSPARLAVWYQPCPSPATVSPIADC
ncbi:MAG: TIGR04283 family arsenosugar biosynthesis glycosyltransferase [Pseudomonadota bacterium]